MLPMIGESLLEKVGLALMDVPAQALQSNYPVVGATISTGNFIVYSLSTLYLGTMYGGFFSVFSVLFYIPVFLVVLYVIYVSYSLVVSYKVTDATNYPNTYFMSTLYSFVTAFFVYFLLTMPLQFVMGILFSIP